MPDYQNPEFFRPASPEEISRYLLLLAVLPARAVLDMTIINQAYAMALDGVELHALQQATRNILKGCLGHAFMPSPPELRQECERIMQPLRLQRQRHGEYSRLRRDSRAVRAEHCEAARARVKAMWDSIRPLMATERPLPVNEIAAAQARLAARAAEQVEAAAARAAALAASSQGPDSSEAPHSTASAESPASPENPASMQSPASAQSPVCTQSPASIQSPACTQGIAAGQAPDGLREPDRPACSQPQGDDHDL